MIDFTRVKFEPRCKLCNLYRVDKKLFEQIHDMILHVGFSNERARHFANKKIVKLNEKLSKQKKSGLEFFNAMNFSSHFRNHLPIDVATALKIRTSTLNAVRPENEEVEYSLQKYMDDSLSSNLSDYEKLSKLVDRFERRADELEEIVDQRGMSWKYIGDYSNFIKELSRMRADLIKLKQSDRLVSMIVTQVLHQYTMGSLKEVLSTVEQIKAEISTSCGDDHLADKVANRLRTTIVDGMQDQAKEVVQSARKQFRLKL